MSISVVGCCPFAFANNGSQLTEGGFLANLVDAAFC